MLLTSMAGAWVGQGRFAFSGCGKEKGGGRAGLRDGSCATPRMGTLTCAERHAWDLSFRKLSRAVVRKMPARTEATGWWPWNTRLAGKSLWERWGSRHWDGCVGL